MVFFFFLHLMTYPDCDGCALPQYMQLGQLPRSPRLRSATIFVPVQTTEQHSVILSGCHLVKCVTCVNIWVFEDRTLRRIFGPERKWHCIDAERHDLYFALIIRVKGKVVPVLN
jgi:hypothetical protein